MVRQRQNYKTYRSKICKRKRERQKKKKNDERESSFIKAFKCEPVNLFASTMVKQDSFVYLFINLLELEMERRSVVEYGSGRRRKFDA